MAQKVQKKKGSASAVKGKKRSRAVKKKQYSEDGEVLTPRSSPAEEETGVSSEQDLFKNEWIQKRRPGEAA